MLEGREIRISGGSFITILFSRDKIAVEKRVRDGKQLFFN
jgi:hypothetical protein